jgi:hypothetical protein
LLELRQTAICPYLFSLQRPLSSILQASAFTLDFPEGW